MGKIQPLLVLGVLALGALLGGCATPPLLTAAAQGDDAQVQTLLNGGADVNESSWKGLPLFQAAKNGRASTVKLLLDHGAQTEYMNVNVLCLAVMSDSVPTVKVLADHGIPLDEPFCMAPYHWTPLQLALGYEKSAVAAYLRAHGGGNGGGARMSAAAAGGSASGGMAPAAGAASRGTSMLGAGAPPEAVEPDESAAPAPQNP